MRFCSSTGGRREEAPPALVLLAGDEPKSDATRVDVGDGGRAGEERGDGDGELWNGNLKGESISRPRDVGCRGGVEGAEEFTMNGRNRALPRGSSALSPGVHEGENSGVLGARTRWRDGVTGSEGRDKDPCIEVAASSWPEDTRSVWVLDAGNAVAPASTYERPRLQVDGMDIPEGGVASWSRCSRSSRSCKYNCVKDSGAELEVGPSGTVRDARRAGSAA